MVVDTGGSFMLRVLYLNLAASIADIAPPQWRGSAIGIYRFWRDFVYALSALGLGIAAHSTDRIDSAFWFVTGAMIVSGLILWIFGEETHPAPKPPAKGLSRP